MPALNFTVVFLILMGIGILIKKYNIVDANFMNSLSSLVFKIIFPAMIINAMQLKRSPGDLFNGAVLILIACISLVVMYLLGTLMNAITRCKGDKASILRFGLMFPNFSFMAYPVMEAFYGQKGLFYMSIFTVPIRIAFYTLSGLLIKGFHREEDKKERRKKLVANMKDACLNPAVIAVPIGLFLYVFSVPLPAFLSKTISLLAATATPLGMILCGLALPLNGFMEALSDKKVLFQSFFRLILAPLVALLLFSLVDVDPLVRKISILYCALPASASSIIFAIQFKSDADTGAKCILTSTLFSVLTLPAWSWIVEHF